MFKFSAEFTAAAARKPQFSFLMDFSKSKTLWRVLVLFSKIVHKRVSPDKIWTNPWFQFWKSILDIYSPLVLRSLTFVVTNFVMIWQIPDKNSFRLIKRNLESLDVIFSHFTNIYLLGAFFHNFRQAIFRRRCFLSLFLFFL